MRSTLFVLIVLLTAPLAAQEKITLTTPETKPSTAEYRVGDFHLHPDHPATTPLDEGYLQIVLSGQNGEVVSCTYNAQTSPTGTFLITALNKANLSSVYAGNATTGSLTQRVWHRLNAPSAACPACLGESTVICGKTLTGSIVGAVP